MNYQDNVHLNSNRDLEKYGVNPLTSESCGYGLRLLCDLTEHGCELMDAFLGGVEVTSDNWNHGSEADPHVKSIMLPYGILRDLKVYILLHVEQMKYVVVFPDGCMSGTNDDEVLEEIRKHDTDIHVYSNYNQSNTRGGRNVHQMSGRST